MRKRLSRVLRDQRGATAIEYGLIIALLVLSMMVGLGTFADTTIGMWENVADEVQQNS